jgi:Fe-S-cluster containining protein
MPGKRIGRATGRGKSPARPASRRAAPPPDGPRRQPRSPGQWPDSSCDCTACRQACLNSPGWFLPDQLQPLADHLGVPLAEVFRRYLAVGTTLMPDGRLCHGVMPHKLRDHKTPGSIWRLEELAVPGRCIFYDRGRCTIYPVRPFECSRMLHSRIQGAERLRHWIVERWTPTKLKPFLTRARQRRSGGRARPKE